MFGTIALSFFSDSSESESEVSQSDNRIYFKKLRDSTNVLDIPPEQFFRNFRVNKEVFSVILDEVAQFMQPTYRSTHVPTPIKLAKFLAFIATGIATVDHEYASAMCKSQVSKTICEILDIFEQHLYEKWVRLEQTEEEENVVKQHFYNMLGLPGVVGCVDNMYVQIKKPDKLTKDVYSNRKGLHCLNVMMICDHNMVIKYVDPNQPGSYHDAYVWEQSSANTYFKTKYVNGQTDSWLAADSAYNLLTYMMVPYRNPESFQQKLFNEQLYKARIPIKKCFTTLKNRFGCLTTPRGLYYSPDKASKVVTSCCILHNICHAYNNKWSPDNNSVADSDSDENDEDVSEECPVARSLRDELALLITEPVLKKETAHSAQDSNNENKDRLHHFRHSKYVFMIPDDKFMKMFRVNKKVFSILLENIRPKMKPSYRSTHTPSAFKLAKFLSFLATGGQQTTTYPGYDTIISKSLMSKIISEMLDIFEEYLYDKWVKLEQSSEEENIAKDQFYQTYGMPGVVGCVDNLHIQIKTPVKEFKDLYCNRNGFYSLNIMMICDHNMVIKYVDANQPGSYHDAYVWDQSSADSYYKQKTNTWLIGDSAYKLQPYLMIPYKNPSEAEKQKFNEKHFEIRKIIKKCFAILKDRFGCLVCNAGLQYSPEKISKIVIACCILHNICIRHKNYWPLSEAALQSMDDEDDYEENIIEAPNIESAMSIRNEIASSLI